MSKQQQQPLYSGMAPQEVAQYQSPQETSVADQNRAMANLASQVQAAMGHQIQPMNNANSIEMMNMGNQVNENFFSMQSVMQNNPMFGMQSANSNYFLAQPQPSYWMENQTSGIQTQQDNQSVGTQPHMQVAQTQKKIAPKRKQKKKALDSDEGDSKDSTSNRTPEDRLQHNRERNKEHARSTRLRKKAYVQKLEEMVEKLRAIQTEEVRQRRMAMQKMGEVQRNRRSVIHTVLKFHSEYETKVENWENVVERSFWLKQPVTPYRSFQRSEVDGVST